MADVRRVSAAETAWLRQAVLRPGGLLLPTGDDVPDVLHLAAYRDGQLVACGNVRPDPAPFPAEGWHWRVRGMATAPEVRGRGIGGAVLAGLVDHARGAGGAVLWCNARIPAQRLYERAGLQTWGEPWVDPQIGPHIVMWTTLRAAHWSGVPERPLQISQQVVGALDAD